MATLPVLKPRQMDIDEFEDYLELQDPKVREDIRKSNEEYLAGKGRPYAELLADLRKLDSSDSVEPGEPLTNRTTERIDANVEYRMMNWPEPLTQRSQRSQSLILFQPTEPMSWDQNAAGRSASCLSPFP